MEGRNALIAALVVIILVLGVVAGTIFYLTKAFNIRINPLSGFWVNRQVSIPKLSPRPSSNPTIQSKASAQYTPLPGDVVVSKDDKQTYTAQGFQVTFPKNWGLLTCTTSQNIEFDPYNNAKITIPCDRAIKPITVLINQEALCQGEIVKIGDHQVVKSKTQYSDWLTYSWCINEGGKSFDITHRVSPSGQTGTSKDDFSAQVEQIISTIKFQ